MNLNTLYTQWSATFRDLAAAQFGMFMEGWKTMEKNVQDGAKHDWFAIWKK